MNIKFITRFFRFLIPRVLTRRYEILLPLNYNDGSQIEPEKLEQTNDELRDRFGAITHDTVVAIGTWQYGGTRYQDKLVRIRIETDDPIATNAFREYKQTWKKRFRQIDIWITAHEIEII